MGIAIRRIVGFREELVARLVSTICDHHADDTPDMLLRVCLGAALDHDLTDNETQWLISGVEAEIGVSLTPMGRTD